MNRLMVMMMMMIPELVVFVEINDQLISGWRRMELEKDQSQVIRLLVCRLTHSRPFQLGLIFASNQLEMLDDAERVKRDH